MNDKTLGQIAFEAHRDCLDGNRPWSDVREAERQVWEVTAGAVATEEQMRLRRAALDDADTIDGHGGSDVDKLCADTLRHFAELRC